MKKKIISILITLSACVFVLPVGTCASSAVNGVVQAFKPCDVFNCTNPNYFDPCMYIQCSRPTRTSMFTGDTNSSSSSSSSSSTSSSTTSSMTSLGTSGLSF